MNRTAVGLTRVSIFEKHCHFKKLDCRVKPGNDGSYGSEPVTLGMTCRPARPDAKQRQGAGNNSDDLPVSQ